MKYFKTIVSLVLAQFVTSSYKFIFKKKYAFCKVISKKITNFYPHRLPYPQ